MNKMPNVLFSLIVLLALCSMKQATMKRYQLTEGISASVPDNFVPMSDNDIAIRYPSTKKPLAMFTSSDMTVDFGLNVTKSNWAGDDLALLKDVYKSTLYTLYNEVQIIREEIQTVNKQNFVVLEFTSKADQTRKYTFLQYGIFNNRVYIFNFTCPEREMPKWSTTAGEIMASVRVKPGKLKAVEYNPSGTAPSKGKSPREVLDEQKSKSGQKTTGR